MLTEHLKDFDDHLSHRNKLEGNERLQYTPHHTFKCRLVLYA